MKRLLLVLLFISPLSAMELVEQRAVSSKDARRLYTNQKEFYVEDDNAAYRVEKHNINPLLNEVIKRHALGKFKNAGYIRISKLTDGKYTLAAKVRGEGGGPFTGLCAMWGTRAVGYGAFAALVWATGGEALLHTTEIVHGIEIASNSALVAGTLLPTP